MGIGLSISALSVNMQQAMLYTFLLIMPLMLLSGLMTPVSNMPRVLQIATYANPLRFGMDLVRRVYLEGAGLRDVAFDFVPMLGDGGHHAAAGRLAVPQSAGVTKERRPWSCVACVDIDVFARR